MKYYVSLLSLLVSSCSVVPGYHGPYTQQCKKEAMDTFERAWNLGYSYCKTEENK